ncbi:putative Sodium/hydrogen exchanger 11 [Hypsibius exemplaris]|uniref:Sodium/hydrogen exchanger 11 n=1 Tax=Hypsibius exemplaris TaxID=2072580 RepID=A0A9X6RJJ6_HYPEX|nr:putative Sodium/hydrogen exchanger 11 [Hypsibius exemplaris]
MPEATISLSSDSEDCLFRAHCHAVEVFSTGFVVLLACIIKYFHEFWGKAYGVPYSLIAMLVGCCMGFGEYFTREHSYGQNVAKVFTSALKLRGDYVMLLFVPLLLFSPAYQIPLHSLRILWKQILLTSTLGRTGDIACVAFSSTLMIGSKGHVDSWDVLLGLLFGTIVTTTDSINIEDALDRSGCDRSVSTLMAANALIGNCVSFLWHDILLDIMVTSAAESVDAATIIVNIIMAGIAAPAFGLACGTLLSVVMKRVYNYWISEVLIVICMPFLTAWGGYHLCGVSGLTSVIALGLWTNFQKASISAKVQATVDQLLGTFTYVLDVFVYIMAGHFLAQLTFNISEKNTDHTYEFEWTKELAIYFTIFAFNVWSQLATLNIVRPLVSRMKYGWELYDLRNIMLMTWTTPKGAVTLIVLKNLLAINGDTLLDTREEAYPAFKLNVIAAIALSQVFQGLTMSRLLRIMAMNAEHSESPVSILTRKGFLEMMTDLRRDQISSMRQDTLFTDVDWKMVAKHTELDRKEMGLKREDNNPERQMQQTRKYQINGRVLTAQVKCPDCDKISALPREITELNEMAISRIVKAKKMSFRRQYESGMLTAAALKILDSLADEALAHMKNVVTARDIRKYLFSDFAVSIKTKMGKLYSDYEKNRESHLVPPVSRFRRHIFHMVQTPQFEDTIQGIIIANVILTIYSLTATPDDDSVEAHIMTKVMVFLNLGFGMIYTAEALLKMVGLGVKQYFGKSLLTWNKLDFLILLLTYMDIILDTVTLIDPGLLSKNALGGLNPAAVRVLRLVRILRASRALRLLRPLTPHILNLIDIFVTGHLYEAYNVARGFVVAQEEVSLVMNQLVSFQPMAIGYRLEAEQDAREIAHDIGVLNQQRPDIATAVKTRQAIRTIFNTIVGAVLQLKHQGILEENEFAKIDNGLEISMEKIGNLPHRMPMRNPERRLRNMPWVSGDEHIFEVLRHCYQERSFEIGTTFLNVGAVADGIYVIINGLALLKTPNLTRDNEKLGEIYSTDNIKTVFDESSTTKKGKVENVEYALPGNALNEQALLIGFPRRSYVVAETKIDTIFIPADRIFEAFKLAPELEKQMWKHIVVSVVINIELRMHNFSESSYTDEKMRLSGGVIRLASPGQIVAELDFADVFLIVGAVVDLGTGRLHRAPSKMPNATKTVKIKSGRAVSIDQSGRVLYPDYAVFFLVPQDGIAIEEPTIHTTPPDHSTVGTFNSINQFRASVVQRILQQELPDQTNLNLLATGTQTFNRVETKVFLPRTSNTAAANPFANDESELQAALGRAQATRRVRTGSVSAYGSTSAALQMAMTGEQHIRLKVAGFRRSSSIKPPPNIYHLHTVPEEERDSADQHQLISGTLHHRYFLTDHHEVVSPSVSFEQSSQQLVQQSSSIHRLPVPVDPARTQKSTSPT